MKSVAKLGTLILGIIVSIAVVGVVVAIALGYAYGGVKQPSQTAFLQTVACSAEDITRYNEFVTNFPANEEEQKAKVTRMNEFVEGIEAKPGFADDPTCQFIAYAAAASAADASKAKVHLDAVTALSEKGNFPSNQLLDIVSIDSMKSRVDSLSNPNPASNPLGSG